MWTIFQLNSRQSGGHIAEEAKDKNKGNDGGKEGAANVKTYALLLNNSANGPVAVNHGWGEEKKMRKKEATITSHKDRPTWMLARPLPGERGKPCTLITTMVAPQWDSTTDSSPRYHEKNPTVHLKFEIKLKLTVKTCCLVMNKTVNPLIQ